MSATIANVNATHLTYSATPVKRSVQPRVVHIVGKPAPATVDRVSISPTTPVQEGMTHLAQASQAAQVPDLADIRQLLQRMQALAEEARHDTMGADQRALLRNEDETFGNVPTSVVNLRTIGLLMPNAGWVRTNLDQRRVGPIAPPPRRAAAKDLDMHGDPELIASNALASVAQQRRAEAQVAARANAVPPIVPLVVRDEQAAQDAPDVPMP